jgi:phage shock protein A
MALLERVATLIKANINDLIEQAENPEKLVKQLLLDMQNQYMQVKTQVAIATADRHLLEKKQRESLEAQQDWLRKAELAVEKGEDDLARAALERALACENAAKNFTEQIEDQSHQVQHLRDALHRLEQKTTETRAKADVLIAQHRRARLAMRSASVTNGFAPADEPSIERRFEELEKADKVERLLTDLKTKRAV